MISPRFLKLRLKAHDLIIQTLFLTLTVVLGSRTLTFKCLDHVLMLSVCLLYLSTGVLKLYLKELNLLLSKGLLFKTLILTSLSLFSCLLGLFLNFNQLIL